MLSWKFTRLMYISKLTLYCIEALSLKLSRKLGSSRASLKHPNVLHLIFFLVVRIVPTNRLKITSPWNQIFFFYCLRLDFTIYWKTRKREIPSVLAPSHRISNRSQTISCAAVPIEKLSWLPCHASWTNFLQCIVIIQHRIEIFMFARHCRNFYVEWAY